MAQMDFKNDYLYFRSQRKPNDTFTSDDETKLVNRIISMSKTHGGLPYGGFVRDYIVRKSKFKDIDIWFTCLEDAQKFIHNVKNEYAHTCFTDLNQLPQLVFSIIKERQNSDDDNDTNEKSSNEINFECLGLDPTKVPKNNNDESLYPYIVKTLHVIGPARDFGIMVDVVISDTFPVNDFDVNYLTFDGTELKSMHPSKSIQDIVTSIQAQVATITDEYYIKTQTDPIHHGVRLRKFSDKGWTIKGIKELSTLNTSTGKMDKVSSITRYSKRNQHNIKQVSRLMGLGASAEQISEEINIDIKVVRAIMKKIRKHKYNL